MEKSCGLLSANATGFLDFARNDKRSLYTLQVRQNTCNPMPGETLNAPAPVVCAAPAVRTLPRRLLYSIFARIGGSGLDTDAFETLRASYRGGFLGKAIAYDNRQKEIPSSSIHSLRWHPVRLISFLDRPYYYGAKKKYLDWIASRHLETGRYDLFHSWSGDCLRSRRRGRGPATTAGQAAGRMLLNQCDVRLARPSGGLRHLGASR